MGAAEANGVYRRADANMAIYNIDSYSVRMRSWRSAAAFKCQGIAVARVRLYEAGAYG